MEEREDFCGGAYRRYHGIELGPERNSSGFCSGRRTYCALGSEDAKDLQRYDFGNVTNLAWHPTKNSLSFTTSDGELFIYDNFIPKDHESLLQKPLQAAPIFPGPLGEISSNVQRTTLADRSKDAIQRAARRGTPDSLDDILGGDEEMGDFVDDDDGAGYAEDVNLYGKRPNGHLDDIGAPIASELTMAIVCSRWLTRLSSLAARHGLEAGDISVCFDANLV